MIEYIKGNVSECNPAYAVIDINGIGYLLNISLTTFSALENAKDAKLLVHEIIREDTHQLYGFATDDERELFRLLIGVSGIGANTARMILSALAPGELRAVITAGDHKPLKNVKGIGVKTAQRIIVDLRDKIKPSEDTFTFQPARKSDDYDEALAALLMLGFTRQQTVKTLDAIFDADPSVKVEVAIKRALAMM